MRPFHGLPFELAYGFPRAEVFGDFSLEQSDDGFGKSVVVDKQQSFATTQCSLISQYLRTLFNRLLCGCRRRIQRAP